MEFYPKYRLKGHRDSLYAICGDEHPDFFFTAGGDGLVARWSANADDDATLLVKVPATVYSLLLLHQHLLVATREGGIHWVNLEEKAEKNFSVGTTHRYLCSKRPTMAGTRGMATVG